MAFRLLRVCVLGNEVGVEAIGEKEDKRNGRVAGITVFCWVFFGRCGIALYPFGYRQDTVADTMDVFVHAGGISAADDMAG